MLAKNIDQIAKSRLAFESLIEQPTDIIGGKPETPHLYDQSGPCPLSVVVVAVAPVSGRTQQLDLFIVA